jgi:hypothetical protein
VWSHLIKRRRKVIKVGFVSFKLRLSQIFTSDKNVSHSKSKIVDFDQVIYIVDLLLAFFLNLNFAMAQESGCNKLLKKAAY